MLKNRIIPVLLYDGHFAVHTSRHKRPARRIGPIDQYVRNMANRDIDELVLIDITATEQGRKPRVDQIKKFTQQLFCPVTYGGGIRDVWDVQELIKYCGVDKVLIKTHDQIIPLVANRFGSQAVTYAMDTWGDVIYGIDSLAWAKKQVELGVGEILLTDVEQQGTMTGYNNLLINKIAYNVGIPVIANGGCGGIGDMIMALSAGASAVAASSVFTLRGLTPQDAARALRKAGIPVRVPPTYRGEDASQEPRQPCPDASGEDT